MAYVKKYQKGESPLTPHEAFEEITDRNYIFFDDRVVSPGWAQNWSIATLRGLCGKGVLYPAFVSQEWKIARGKRLKAAVDAAVESARLQYAMKEIAQ